MVRLSVSESNFSRLCKLAFSRFHGLATNGVEVQTVRSGITYAVGSLSAQMCPAKAVSLASTWVRTYSEVRCTFLGFKANRASVLRFPCVQ